MVFVNWRARLAAMLCLALLAIPLAGLAEAGSPRTLTMASGAELNTLYPLNMDPQNNLVTRMVYEGLVTYQEGEVKPLLAESWSFSEDGTALTFRLREGVTFHDGAPFDAEAVKANLEFYHASPNHGNIKAVANLTDVQVVDNHTVTIHYDAPYFAYLNDFCYPEVVVMVSPAVLEAGNFQTMRGVVGTGPYVYAELVKGSHTRFVKNAAYWGDAPAYDEVIVRYIHEASSRLQALKNGEVDMLFGNVLISYDDYQQALAMNGIEGIMSETNSETRNLVLNAAGPMLGELSVREAVACAIDKAVIANGLTYGYEEVADALFDRTIKYCDVALTTVRVHDREKAAGLLDAAGWIMNEATGVREKDGTPLKLRFTYDSGEVLNKSLATVIKSQLSEVDIDVETQGMDMYAWWMAAVAGEYDITIWNTEQPYTSPHNFFTPMLSSSPHTFALTALEGAEEFKAAILEFARTDDEARVREIFNFLINYSNDNVLDIPLTYVKDMIVYNSQVIGGYDFGSTPMFFSIDRLVSK